MTIESVYYRLFGRIMGKYWDMKIQERKNIYVAYSKIK